MTMIEKVEAVKQVQDYVDDIKDKLELIIRRTYDSDCIEVIGFTVDGETLHVRYLYCYGGENVHSYADVPVAWLDEGFDYKEAYKKMKGL